MDFFDLSNKKAIVTGGTRGLGYSMAEGLMEAGAETVIFGSNEKVREIAEKFCGSGFSCSGIAVDLADAEARQTAFTKAVEILGGLDILVNCAGIQRRYPSVEFPAKEWDEVLNVNLTAPFSLCQMAAREFLKKEYGKIINISSLLAFFGGYTVPAYAAAKGGISQMTKALCNEWAGSGININAIAPGYMDTEMNTALTNPDNPRYHEITGRIPAGRWGAGDDLKGACIFLASHASDYVNGVTLPVDGGYLAR